MSATAPAYVRTGGPDTPASPPRCGPPFGNAYERPVRLAARDRGRTAEFVWIQAHSGYSGATLDT